MTIKAGALGSLFSEMESFVLRSHRQIRPSRPPLTKRLSFEGCHAIVFTVLVCTECKVCSADALEDLGSVMHIFLSPDAVAISESDGDHLTSNIPFVCTCKVVRLGSIIFFVG